MRVICNHMNIHVRTNKDTKCARSFLIGSAWAFVVRLCALDIFVFLVSIFILLTIDISLPIKLSQTKNLIVK